MRASLLALVFAAVAVLPATGAATATAPAPSVSESPVPLHERCSNKPHRPPQPVPAALKLPDDLPPGEPPQVAQLELSMLAYLSGHGGVTGVIDPFPYRRLGWCVDKYVRDTGPYINTRYYGTHKAVRIYYSPEMMTWLRGDRRGMPADGAVIIKEQYPPPAALYGRTDAELDKLQTTDWIIMIRNSKASHDGWWWAELYNGMQPGGTAYPNAGYGLYCLRCHASAQKALTFSSTRNIKGFPGDPITFFVDDSWRTPPPKAAAAVALAQLVAAHDPQVIDAHPKPLKIKATPPPVVTPFQTFPPEPYDQMLARPTHMPRAHFLTSDQCIGCHSGASGPIAGPVMWLTPPPAWSPAPSPVPTAPPPYGVNVSPYGEWRWSPMGLAGRDPIFFSQLESEIQFVNGLPLSRFAGSDPKRTQQTVAAQVVDTCMRCHGVMGKRTNDADHPGSHFNADWVFATWPSPIPGHAPAAAQLVSQQQFHYGGLARDGISCTVCHQIRQTKAEQKSLALVLDKTATGLFEAERELTQLHGPFDKPIAAHPMKETLGIKPAYDQITTSARLCASCHSIDLPVVDKPAVIGPISSHMPLPEPHDVEQNTYVEWVNSSFQTEYPVPPNPAHPPRSCQACHMPASVTNDRLGVTQNAIQTRIAITQDQTYPEADHLAPIKDLTVTYRTKGFARHELLGLNAFLLRTFQQNGEALGVRIPDYMSGSYDDLGDAIGNVVRQATTKTATIAVTPPVVQGDNLTTDVTVTNLTGHRFPSGVGFRRAFVELDVTDTAGNVLWASGMTNDRGEIVIGPTPASRVLPTEMLPRGVYQRHHDKAHPITGSDNVQIYEELVTSKDGEFTESFIRRDAIVKDNRVLPYGWKFDGPSGIKLPHRWLEASRPKGTYVECRRDGKPVPGCDTTFNDGQGHAVVGYSIPLSAIGKPLDASQMRVKATLWYQSWEPKFLHDRTSQPGAAATRLRELLKNLKLENTPMKDWKLRIACAPEADCAPRP